jgi:hypothetical protein
MRTGSFWSGLSTVLVSPFPNNGDCIVAQSVQSVKSEAMADTLQECVSQDYTVRNIDSSCSNNKNEKNEKGSSCSGFKNERRSSCSGLKNGKRVILLRLKTEKRSFCISFKTNEGPPATASKIKKRSFCSSHKKNERRSSCSGLKNGKRVILLRPQK